MLQPEPGQVVRVRSRQYLVEEVEPALAEGISRQRTRVSLSCLDDDAQGQAISVLWETELDAEVLSGGDWNLAATRGFDSPQMFAAYLNTQRWNLVTSTTPRLFQAPWRAGIQVLSYQLEPLRKALALPRVNLFIADDVGLGKTIEAGLILREMLMRQKVKRVVVAAPPSVVPQWKDELEQRFGLNFVIFDRKYVQARRKERGYSANPWKTHNRFIISHALLRDEQYAAPLRDWLGSYAPDTLLILDEAHHAAPSSSSKYAIDSRFTRVVREVARRFGHRLFLSATPHNGHSNSFAALLEILDAQRFVRGVPVQKSQLDDVMVRRLKSDLRGLGEGDFPERKVDEVVIDGLPEDAPELRLMELLDEYRTARELSLKDLPKSVQNTAGLVQISLQKRLLSSIEAFACSLRAHRRGLEKRQAKEEKARRKRKGRQLVDARLLSIAPGADDEEGELSEEDQNAESEAAMEQASEIMEEGAELQAEERRLLDEMTDLAEANRAVPDPRIEFLTSWLKQNLCPELGKQGAKWEPKRLLIFTEWLDTKRYLEERIREAIATTDRAEERVAVFHGGMGDDSRELVKQAFNASPDEHPLRILIATDAAREGINLQSHCADLFHFDLPWNPSRLEQRNGRIDRKLQRAPEVHCHYFVFSQRPEDRVLKTLVQKTERIQKELGSLSQVLQNQIADRLEKRGLSRAHIDELCDTIDNEDLEPERKEAVSQELEASRERKAELDASIERLRTILSESEKALGFDVESFRGALSCSLKLLGAEPLERKEIDNDPTTKEFVFPDLDKRAGADPTWASTLDTLRPPRERKQKLWEWRKEASVRPVVFHDTGRMDAQFVHLHLEHRVVQRLLGRFMAQGFVSDDLTRANVILSRDSIRRVVLLGKLSLYGDGASRLHEELIPVTARWAPADSRDGPLKPYAKDAEAKTLESLFESFKDPVLHEVPEATKTMLSTHVGADVKELLEHLKGRADDAEGKARRLLDIRAGKEAKDMVSILETQKTRIEKELANPQQELAFSKLEQKQREDDRSHMDKRLREIDRELVAEPERIKKSYEVRLARVEPIGVVYLWPVSG